MLGRWRGETVCICASGPSMTKEDAAHALARARVIVINETWRLCPSAHVLYAADYHWWASHGPRPEDFLGERWSVEKVWPEPLPECGKDVRRVPSAESTAITDRPPISTGSNSSFQAMHLAYLWGAKRIVFLGLDLSYHNGLSHWHGDHPRPLANSVRALNAFQWAFTQAAPQLASKGVEVINASRHTALKCFPCAPLEEVLP